MKNQTLQMNFAEKAIVAMCAAVWRVLQLFDPFRVQRYFAAKVNVSGVAINKVHTLGEDDAVAHICRINNNRMKDGENFLAKRGELIKVFNPQNGKFVLRFAHGAAAEHRIRFSEIGLDYNAKLELGISNDEDVLLQTVKANAADREFYLMYQDRDVSSRQSRALSWYVFLGILMFGLLSLVIDGAVSAGTAMF